MDRFFTEVAQKIAGWSGQPGAFILAFLTILGWSISGPIFHFSDTWQLVINTGTTIITFLMVFLIQNAQNRDGSAIQAKLDELIRASKNARNEFIGIEHFTDGELTLIRNALEEHCRGATVTNDSARQQTIERLIERL